MSLAAGIQLPVILEEAGIVPQPRSRRHAGVRGISHSLIHPFRRSLEEAAVSSPALESGVR